MEIQRFVDRHMTEYIMQQEKYKSAINDSLLQQWKSVTEKWMEIQRFVDRQMTEYMTQQDNLWNKDRDTKHNPVKPFKEEL